MELQEDAVTLKFVLVAHGVTTTEEQLHYQTITKMDTIHYYCPHGHVLHASTQDGEFRDIDDIIESTSFDNIYESISAQPIENSKYNMVYLPPMLWEGDTKYDNFRSTLGIYYIPANGRYMKILDNDFLNSNNTTKTFSQIEKGITKYIKRELTMQNYKIELFIFSCRGFHSRYTNIQTPSFVASDISRMMNITYNPRIQPEPRLHVETHIVSDLRRSYIFRVNCNYAQLENRISNEWSGALGQILYQGCGINILQFLNKLDVTDARNRVLVLYKTGTSIFKFMDYLYSLYTELDIRTMSAYTFSVSNALKYLYDTKDVIKDNYVIPAKIYRNNDPDDERGHYVLFYVKSGAPYEIMVIDPQSQKAETWDIYSKFYNNPMRITLIFFQTQQPYTDNNFLPKYVTENKATRLYRKTTNLLWGGGHHGGIVKRIESQMMTNEPLYLVKTEPTKTQPVKTKLAKPESVTTSIAKLKKLKEKLINKLLVEIYCYDEFALNIPEEEKKNFKHDKKTSKKVVSKTGSTKSKQSKKSNKTNKSRKSNVSV